MTTDLTLTHPPIYERKDKPPSIETDDDHLVRRCKKCSKLYRLRGFQISEVWLEAVMRAEQRMFGLEPDGVCPGCADG